MTMYKVLGANGESIHGGSGVWPLPHDGQPGEWTQAVKPRVCVAGWHLVELRDLPAWLKPDCTIWEAEGRGPSDSDGNGKTAYTQARLIRQVFISQRSMRLFAADCAEHVLPLFEAEHPDDQRPREAIAAARAFAHGQIDDDTLDAARAAAWDAAGAAAGAAAWAAAWAAARDAARATAEGTAWAAWATARDAAWDAAGAAAWAAAWAAARDAARATAEGTAWAAWATARDAAWDAAWDAERTWQAERLATYLTY